MNDRSGAVGIALVLTALGAGVLASLPASAQARTVSCRVESAGNPVFSGKCRYNAAGGGSFVLEHSAEGRSITGPILTVSVTIVKPDVAEVRGLTKAGINSRWGEAKRAGGDRACWVGADFRVCAW